MLLLKRPLPQLHLNLCILSNAQLLAADQMSFSPLLLTRKIVCALTKTGQYIITLDSSTLTHIADFFGLKAMQ